MKFLVDNALSTKISTGLIHAGHDAVHLRDLGKQDSSDEDVFELAITERRILISADTDFGTMLALRRISRPSVILFRRSMRRPEAQVSFLLANLPSLTKHLKEGSIIILEDSRIRVRSLPIGGSPES